MNKHSHSLFKTYLRVAALSLSAFVPPIFAEADLSNDQYIQPSPPGIAFPAGDHLLLNLYVSCVQIYTCTEKSADYGTYSWINTPEATFFKDSKPVGRNHFDKGILTLEIKDRKVQRYGGEAQALA
jgi:hypothetical protein